MHQQTSFDRIRDGVVGTFTPVMDPPKEKWPDGSLRLTDDLAEVVLVADHEFLDGILPPDCEVVAGVTEVGEILLMPISRRGGSHGRISTAKYASKILLVGAALEEVDGTTVTDVQLGYHGLLDWSRNGGLSERALMENDKQVGWISELRFSEAKTGPVDEGFNLRFSPGWEIAGPYDRRVHSTPLYVTIESETRRPISDHIIRLDAVHALFNIAHRTKVKADRGSVRFASERFRCAMWETNMMELDAAEAPTQEFAYFGLEHIGGVPGVAAWIRLVLNHRRAVEPIVRHKLHSNQSPQARLLSTAAAMATWVGVHSRTHAWAARVKGQPLPTALTKCVDPAWEDWIGNSADFARRFWDANNHIKHEPLDDLDRSELHTLEIAGRWLLTAALLDSCAGSNAPSNHLFSQSLKLLGSQTRESLFGEPPGQRL